MKIVLIGHGMVGHKFLESLAETGLSHVDVTVLGTEANLLAVFQRKLNPAAGLLLGQIKVEGSKSALLKLAALL